MSQPREIMRHSPQKQGIEVRKDQKGSERFRGTAYDRKTGKVIRGPWERSLAAARSWRTDAQTGIANGTLSGNRGMLLRDAIDRFVKGIEDGTVENRSGQTFKPSVVRDYRRDLQERVAEDLGATYMGELAVSQVQRLVDRLRADGLANSNVRNTIMALRSVYRWAIPRGYAHRNPCIGVELPSSGGIRERIASPNEASLLVGALTGRDRTAFALACYAGLRAGELLALDWSSVDTTARTIWVERGWDHGGGGFIAPKSKAAHRMVPTTQRLTVILEDHADQYGTEGLLLPRLVGAPDQPMSHSALSKRIKKRQDAAGLERLGLHESRHTFASICIAAGVNAKAISTYLGHSSIQITFDTYGHLFPGSEVEMLGLVDGYLEETL